MNFDELVAVLNRLNRASDKPVNEALLKEIVALVMKNPLPQDRAQCQERLALIIAQQLEGKKRDH
jgi:hypothetical protein